MPAASARRPLLRDSLAWAGLGLAVAFAPTPLSGDALIPGVGVDAGLADVELVNFHRLQPGVGATIANDVAMTMNGEVTYTMGGDSFSGDMTAVITRRTETTVREVEDGLPVAWRVRFVEDLAEHRVRMMGQVEEGKEPGQLAGLSVDVRVVNGRLEAKLAQGQPNAEQRAALDAEFTGPPEYAMYPDRPITIGDEWEIDEQLIAGFTGNASMQIRDARGTGRYLRNDELAGRPVAVFSFTTSLTGVDDSEGVDMTVTMDYEGTEFRCLEHGVLLKNEGRGPIDMTGDIQDGLSMSIDGEMILESTGDLAD